jgi:hypothetical protein
MRTQQTHPGEVETYPGAMEAYPGAIVVHYVAKKLILEPWRHKVIEAHPRSMRTEQTHNGEVETYPGATEAYPEAIVVHHVAKNCFCMLITLPKTINNTPLHR